MLTKSSRLPLQFILVFLGGILSCNQQGASPIELGVGHGEPRQLVPVVAFAEYIELPGLRNELRLTLADYEASCERFVPPPEGKAVVNIVVATPPNQPIQPGNYTWAGAELRGNQAGLQQHPTAEPTARIGGQSFLFGPGGMVQLQTLRLDTYGEVVGVLGFEAAATESRGPTRIRGPFRAKICRSNRAPAE